MTTPGAVVVVDEGPGPTLAWGATGLFTDCEERTRTTAPRRAMRTTPATPMPTRTVIDDFCRLNHRMTVDQMPDTARVDAGPFRKWWRARVEKSDSDSDAGEFNDTGGPSTIGSPLQFRCTYAERRRKVPKAMYPPTTREGPFNPAGWSDALRTRLW
jgi:hypothetical protein